MVHVFGALAEISSGVPTFGDNFQVSDKPFLPEQYGGDMFMTDYDVAAADEDYFYFAWTDNRRKTRLWFNFGEGPVAAFLNEQNIRFIRIDQE